MQGHIPPTVASLHLQPISVLPTSQHLQLAIGLPLRNTEALTNLLQQIYDPASPNYHNYLTPQQFTEEFGPTEQDYQAVIAFAKANGLTVTGTHPNRVLLDVNGTVAEVQKAFHVTMRVYQHPTENRTFYAPDAEPSLDLAVPILHISGLDNYSLPRPGFHLALPTKAQNVLPNAGSGPVGNYMGKDFRAAYVPGTRLAGSGQVVGLLQFDGYTPGDIAYYEGKAGLPSITLSNVLIDGASGGPSGNGGEVEVSLDIEMAISMATNLSEVMVYMAPNPSPWADLLNRMADDNAAKQLSSSWFISGGTIDPTVNGIFQQMAAQGQTFFQASGDDDAYTGLIPFPCDRPDLTVVGGTTLTTSGPGGSWVSETVWNWGGGVGSGGGISTDYPIPVWQRGISMAANRGSTVYRNIPDVALTADNIYVRADGLDYTNIGGTSCAAPLWAGFTALINQQGAASSKPSVGFINPAIYAIGKGTNYNLAFHDITTGNNTSPSSPGKFLAVSNYDLCTGWGTPNGTNLINALAPLPDALQITPQTVYNWSFPVGSPSGAVQTFDLTNIGAASLTWSLINTSLWLNVSLGSSTLAAGGKTIVIVSLNNSTAAALPIGNYAATVLFTNSNSGVVQARQFTVQVQPLVVNGGFETGDFTGWILSALPNLTGNGTNMFVTGNPQFVESGNYAARLGPIGSLNYLSQMVPTITNQAYLLSFWVENAGGGTPNEFEVSWNGNTLYDQVNLPPFGWTNMQFNVSATGTNTLLQFGIRDDPQYFDLDNVTVTANSAPVFQMLTLTDNTFAFSWNAVTGTVYQLQYTTNLSQPNWINLGGAITAADVTVSTNVVIGPDPQRFYRLMSP
ncbi:MAG: protease pro-enzyme activation domain-containing protein [Verrucomicrobiia bacterium]